MGALVDGVSARCPSALTTRAVVLTGFPVRTGRRIIEHAGPQNLLTGERSEAFPASDESIEKIECDKNVGGHHRQDF